MLTLEKWFILCGIIAVSFQVATCSTSKDLPSSFVTRRKCPYFQQSGCLLTVLEEICDQEGDQISPSDLQFGAVSERCCCPRPFKSCTEDEVDPLCKSFFDKNFKAHADKFGDRIKLLQSYNTIRQELLKVSEECQEHLNVTSYECGVEGPYKATSNKISHQCEQLLWLYEELGFKHLAELDLEEFDCSFNEEDVKVSEDLVARLPPESKDENEDNEEDEKNEDSASSQDYRITSYQDRRKCRYWQQSGCLLDVMEKLCEGENEIEDHFSGYENVFLCCCPTPYKACKKSEANQNCIKAMQRQFPKSIIGNLKIDTTLESLQEVRKVLLNSDKTCQQYLAPVEPFATCSANPKPFSRHDLTCEMLSWQWEELGDGNKAEFDRIKCPFLKKNKSKNGELRKGAEKFLAEDSQKIEL